MVRVCACVCVTRGSKLAQPDLAPTAPRAALSAVRGSRVIEMIRLMMIMIIMIVVIIVIVVKIAIVVKIVESHLVTRRVRLPSSCLVAFVLYSLSPSDKAKANTCFSQPFGWTLRWKPNHLSGLASEFICAPAAWR